MDHCVHTTLPPSLSLSFPILIFSVLTRQEEADGRERKEKLFFLPGVKAKKNEVEREKKRKRKETAP